jgi:hypothetical protein
MDCERGFRKETDFFLLHDKCACPQSYKCLSIFDPKYVTILYHLPYSPNVPLTDYFLFPKLKIRLNRLHLAGVAEIREAVTDELKKVQKDKFSAGFHKIYDRANASLYANGAYLNKMRYVYSSCFFY